MISKYSVYLSEQSLSVLVKLLMKQWEHSFKKVYDNELWTVARIRPALALAVNRPCAWDSRPVSSAVKQRTGLAQWLAGGPSSSTFIFVQIALGRQGLWKRNISEEASSEKQTPKSIIKDLALNKNWPRRKINNRGNHTSGREACCKSFWKTKQYQRAPHEINQTHRLRLKLQDYIMNLEK